MSAINDVKKNDIDHALWFCEINNWRNLFDVDFRKGPFSSSEEKRVFRKDTNDPFQSNQFIILTLMKYCNSTKYERQIHW